MARIRTIKPAFFQHEELSSLSAETHLLAAGLLCHADDAGFFLANPKLVQAAVFPLRELSGEIPEMLRSLQRIGWIQVGTGNDGKRYGKVVTFLNHQRIRHPTPSVISNMEIVWEDSGEIPEDSVSAPESLRPERKGREGNKERKSPSANVSGDGANGLHGKIRSAIQEAFTERYQMPCPWDGSEGAALSKMLKANPSWTKEHWSRMLTNLFESDGITGQRPRQWLPVISQYAAGPLDRFGKVKA